MCRADPGTLYSGPQYESSQEQEEDMRVKVHTAVCQVKLLGQGLTLCHLLLPMGFQ